MTRKARCTGVRMPITMIAGHKSVRMRFGICTLDAIRVDMTLHTDGVGSLNVVTRLAAFNFAARKTSVFSASRPDADCHKSRRFMGSRNCSAKRLASGLMAIVAESLFLMTYLTICGMASRLDTVGEAVIDIVDHLPF